MRLSEIQQRRNLPPESQPIPVRRSLVWLLVAAGIAVGVVLYFAYARSLTPLLAPTA